jgi:two-component system response regulator ArlR
MRHQILCADDDHEILEDMRYILNNLGYEVLSAHDGEEALRLFDEHRPRILILDISMPKLDGLSVASKIKEIDESAFVIIVSAHSERDKLLSAIDTGVSAYIIKPYKIDEIRVAIDKALTKLGSKNHLPLKGSFFWNQQTSELTYDQQIVKTTKNEKQLITTLISHPHKYFSSDELSYEIFFDSTETPSDKRITQLISRFKAKLVNLSKSDDYFIESTYGLGYKIILAK